MFTATQTLSSHCRNSSVADGCAIFPRPLANRWSVPVEYPASVALRQVPESIYWKGVTVVANNELQERLALASAEGWNPSEGDTLIGTILDIKASRENEYGIYPIVTLATEQGNVAVHAFHELLKNGLMEARPAVGERIAIAYLGERQSKANDDRTYHNYSVVVDRPSDDTSDSWDSFAE